MVMMMMMMMMVGGGGSIGDHDNDGEDGDDYCADGKEEYGDGDDAEADVDGFWLGLKGSRVPPLSRQLQKPSSLRSMVPLFVGEHRMVGMKTAKMRIVVVSRWK